MKNIFYFIIFFLGSHFLLLTAQSKEIDEVRIEVIESAYETVIEGKYTIQGRTWSQTKNMFEQKIKSLQSLEDTSPGTFLHELLTWKIWFAKFRFKNGEFKQFQDDLNSIEGGISRNDTSSIAVDLSDIEEEITNERRIYMENVNNEQDIMFSNLYIKLRGQEIPEKRKVVYAKNGNPVKIQFKYPTKDLNALQKSRLDYLNTNWFMDLVNQENDMRLGFFTHTDSLKLEGNFDSDLTLKDGYVLSIPDLPILREDQEYIFILEDGDGTLKRYRHSFNRKNYDSKLLEIFYMSGWALQPSPSPSEIELRLPADRYAVKTSSNEIVRANDDINYSIEVQSIKGDNIDTVDPMEAPIVKGDGRSYYVYYIEHNEDIKLEISVDKNPIKKSIIKKYFIWIAITLGIGGYYAQ
jgi:hypothetical protein